MVLYILCMEDPILWYDCKNKAIYLLNAIRIRESPTYIWQCYFQVIDCSSTMLWESVNHQPWNGGVISKKILHFVRLTPTMLLKML